MARGSDDVLGRCILGHEGRCSGLKCFEELVVTCVHRQDHDADLGIVGPHLATRLEPVAVRQPHIKDHDVGVEQAEESPRIGE